VILQLTFKIDVRGSRRPGVPRHLPCQNLRARPLQPYIPQQSIPPYLTSSDGNAGELRHRIHNRLACILQALRLQLEQRTPARNLHWHVEVLYRADSPRRYFRRHCRRVADADAMGPADESAKEGCANLHLRRWFTVSDAQIIPQRLVYTIRRCRAHSTNIHTDAWKQQNRVCIISAFRVALNLDLHLQQTDFPRYAGIALILAIFEINLSIICASLPVMQPILTRLSQIIKLTFSRSSSPHSRTNKFSRQRFAWSSKGRRQRQQVFGTSNGGSDLEAGAKFKQLHDHLYPLASTEISYGGNTSTNSPCYDNNFGSGDVVVEMDELAQDPIQPHSAIAVTRAWDVSSKPSGKSRYIEIWTGLWNLEACCCYLSVQSWSSPCLLEMWWRS